MQKLIVFTGTSGSGKTTIAAAILAQLPFFKRVVTCTTRAMRPGEINDIDYHFISKEKFEQLVKQDAFLEHANVYGNYSGPLKSEVEGILAEGKSVLLVVDVQGALTIKSKFPACVTIFFKTPTLEILRERLAKRGTDSKEVIDNRMKVAQGELELEKKFDFSIVNDDLKTAIKETKEIILSNLKK